ncbi:hypothetical protein [Jeotgalibacillus proteolyticus]|uniref:Uncharacterized protein n=1 Tax=Jeotgalibacillus proteolyticus TaxID=2082395 RepID=A0A2S5GCB6_9BACL|nr:hypothetical protein [Jeotgalibacillus proteolyticus]PPA70650.1 hypothetical protein C4B60_07575 [Jeotgalibacillus proteolyticus]
MKKDNSNDNKIQEEYGEEVLQQQIQDVYMDGTIEREEQNRKAKETGSVKGDKKTSGPDYPAT